VVLAIAIRFRIDSYQISLEEKVMDAAYKEAEQRIAQALRDSSRS
jgi:hypothetical protein